MTVRLGSILALTFLYGCANAPQVGYQLQAMPGATLRLTEQQAEVVCRERARAALRAEETSNSEIRKQGGFIQGMIANETEKAAAQSAFRACLAEAGYMLRQVDHVKTSRPQSYLESPETKLAGSRTENGILICNYGSVAKLTTRRYAANTRMACPDRL